MDGQHWRKTSQTLRPIQQPTVPGNGYTLYPAHALPSGSIGVGFGALTEALTALAAPRGTLVIDGCSSVFWENLRGGLDAVFRARGVRVAWLNIETALHPTDAIERLVQPFLGGDDPLFGTRFTGVLADFFDPARLADLQPEAGSGLSILYGCGAALAGWNAPLVYIDLPKSEAQFRARAGSIRSFGDPAGRDSKAFYKRAFFVDWVAQTRHQARILPQIALFVDEQRPDDPAFVSGEVIRTALANLSRSCIRARPWFEPGVWGGQWIKQHIPEVSQQAVNYAWSFELITPENGLLFESDGLLMELCFQWLMAQESRAVLGDCADRFGAEFPIRFDFLDTVDGDNLSIQVHPRPEYAHAHFGEPFTQDETYYIMDCKPGASVYLGFRERTDPAAFCIEFEESAQQIRPVDVPRFIHVEAAQKHGLYLIPSGTVHGAGKDNLILEISATPYIFTFKIYDWMRLDLDSQPRTLNLERAFANLDFKRAGERIPREFVSHPGIIAEGADWCIVHLPTHPEHFYDVHRLEFSKEIDIETNGSAHILNLVEGDSIEVVTDAGTTHRFSYAETFVIPAAANRYRLRNLGSTPVKVIKAFMKPTI